MPGERDPETRRSSAPRAAARERPSLAQPRPEGAFLEIQFHPAAVARGVRCTFLDRRKTLWATVGLVVYLLLLVIGVLASPWAIGGLWRAARYDHLLDERRAQGERLQGLVAALEEAGRSTDSLELKMRRIYLAYGLGDAELEGQGGYPFAPSPVPDSIYAGLVEHGASQASAVGERLAVVAAFIEEVVAFEAAHRDQVSLTPSRSPLASADFVLTSPFGMRRSPFTKKLDFHAGIDMAAARGTTIRAPADGEVVFAGRYQLRLAVAWWRYGNLVALRHSDRFITLFGHCDEILVRAGQEVAQGEPIATVGDSGWSTSPHLHYEVRLVDEEGYEPVDPRIYILDHDWRDEEQLLIRARRAPEQKEFEPLPRSIRR